MRNIVIGDEIELSFREEKSILPAKECKVYQEAGDEEMTLC